MLAKNAQTPYDPGPYVKAPLTPVAPDAASSAPGGGVTTTASVAAAGSNPGIRSRTGLSPRPSAIAAAAAQLLDQLSQLPANQIHQYPDSNAWAANGPAVGRWGAARR